MLLVQGNSDSGLEPRHSDSSTCGKENIVRVGIISDKYTSVRIIDSDLRYFEWLCQYFQSGLNDHLSCSRRLLLSYLKELRRAVDSEDVATYQ